MSAKRPSGFELFIAFVVLPLCAAGAAVIFSAIIGFIASASWTSFLFGWRIGA